MCCCLRARGRFVWIIHHHTLFTTASHNFSFLNLPCCTTGSNFLAVPLNLSAENNTWAITLDVKSQVTKACHALTQNLSCTVNSLHFRNLTLCRICTSFYWIIGLLFAAWFWMINMFLYKSRILDYSVSLRGKVWETGEVCWLVSFCSGSHWNIHEGTISVSLSFRIVGQIRGRNVRLDVANEFGVKYIYTTVNLYVDDKCPRQY